MFHFKMVWIDKEEKEFTNFYSRNAASEHDARLQLIRSTYRSNGRVKSLVVCSLEEYNKHSKSEAIKPKKEVTPAKKSIKSKKKKD